MTIESLLTQFEIHIRNSVEFDQKTKREVWNPEIKFENALKYEQTKPYGGDSTFVFWLVYGTSSYEMHYGEEFQITFHCQFHLFGSWML